jgi:CheY-like chemotaxis protein
LEYQVILFMAVVVLVVKTVTGYALVRLRSSIRREERRRSEVDQVFVQVEGTKKVLEREFDSLDRKRIRFERERNRLESEIRILNADPVKESDVIVNIEEAGEFSGGVEQPSAATVPEATLETGAEGAGVPGEENRNGPGGLKPYRILVVEDNGELLDVLSTALGKMYAVEGAEDGSVALERIRMSPFDLVVTDLRMPNLDGIQLIQNLANGIPFIVISANLHSDEFRSDLDKLNPVAVLQKPFNLGELRDAIERSRPLA